MQTDSHIATGTHRRSTRCKQVPERILGAILSVTTTYWTLFCGAQTVQ